MNKICLTFSNNTQTFNGGNMVGCSGTGTFANRGDLCTNGSTVCMVGQYISRRGTTVPTYHYWTNDNLKYSGVSTSCSVHLTTGTDCGATTPMRVCSTSSSDPLSNVCNWTSCGYENTTPVLYFGGCGGNTTAGTLCCY